MVVVLDLDVRKSYAALARLVRVVVLQTWVSRDELVVRMWEVVHATPLGKPSTSCRCWMVVLLVVVLVELAVVEVEVVLWLVVLCRLFWW